MNKRANFVLKLMMFASALIIGLLVMGAFGKGHSGEVPSIRDKQIVLTELVLGKHYCKVDVIPDYILDELNASIAHDLSVTPQESASLIMQSAKNVWLNLQETNYVTKFCEIIREKSYSLFTKGV